MPVGNFRAQICSGALPSALLAVGCASQVTQSWVGRSIDSALVRYGPPTEVVEAVGGRKAYRWRIERSEAVRVDARGMSTDHGSIPIWAQGATVATSGRSVDHCILTLTARWDRDVRRWLIEEADGPRCP